MTYHALDRHALEPPMPAPWAAVARHRPGLVLLVALLAPVAAWSRHPALLVSGATLLALLLLRVRLAATEQGHRAAPLAAAPAGPLAAAPAGPPAAPSAGPPAAPSAGPLAAAAGGAQP